MSAVKIGIVGLGQRGLQHLNSLWKVEDAEVVALCDPTADNLAEKKIAGYVDGFHMGDIKTYTNFSDFFTGSRLDAIYFAIPPSLHEGEILQAAERGVGREAAHEGVRSSSQGDRPHGPGVGEMEHRRDVSPDVVLVEVELGLRGLRVRQHVGVRQHDALGPAGGAAGSCCSACVARRQRTAWPGDLCHRSHS